MNLWMENHGKIKHHCQLITLPVVIQRYCTKDLICVYISFVITKLLMIKEITVDMFLNQALAGEGWLSGFLNYFGVDVGMHVCVCMYVCVSAPQAMKNHSSK